MTQLESLMNQVPLLSIVIPTHNRAHYAVPAISGILSNLKGNVELVVHDTSDDDVLASYAKGITDSRLTYRHVRERLSMTENHNRALQIARGEYVCVIGDDDGVSPEIEIATEWAKRNYIDILSPRVTANYVWPDFRSRFLGGAHAGRLYVKRRFSRIAKRNTGQALGRALSRATMGTEGLPKVYHGIVRRALLDKLASVSGNYFHGTSPDISGAIGLALLSDSFVEVDYPLTIPGASGGSNTGRSALNRHKGTLKSDPHTSRFKNLQWPTLIPGFTSVETVWAQTAYETVMQYAPGYIWRFNFMRLYATCGWRHREFLSYTRNAVREYANISNTSVYHEYACWACATFINAGIAGFRFARRAMIPTAAGGRNYVANLATIEDAPRQLMAYLSARQMTFEGYAAAARFLSNEPVIHRTN